MNGGLRSGRFVAWGNAVLAGLVSPDTAADRICGRDRPHRVFGLSCSPGTLATLRPAGGSGADPEPEGASLPVMLAALRSTGATGLRIALPVPGDPLGLPGPAEFNALALEAGEAVLVDGAQACGLVPELMPADPDGPDGETVRWQAHPVLGRLALDVPSLAEAERELAETLREVTEALAAADIARWRPEAAERIGAIRDSAGAEGLAPGYPGRAHRVLALAQRLAAITELAVEDPGAAVSAGSIAARAEDLRPLARAARRAQVAAFNAALEPQR